MGSHESKQNQLFFWKVAALLEGKSEAKIYDTKLNNRHYILYSFLVKIRSWSFSHRYKAYSHRSLG